MKRTPAFPGAEGAGRWAQGGRGGNVIAVTSLADSGPGSLRAAVETEGPRTVIFRVGGTIELIKPLRVVHPYLTIAGQTAPGDGICLKGFSLQIGGTHDVVIRYLRCRPGDKTSQPGEMDAISIWDVKDVIVDHCSATWSTDECLSVTLDADRVTVQNCIIAEALTKHSYGSIIGSYDGAVSFLYNLYANNMSRNPRPGGYQALPDHKQDAGPRIEFRNNVISNWIWGPGYTGSGYHDQPEHIAMNYIGNYLKAGPDAKESGKAFTIHNGARAELFLDGNQCDPAVPMQYQSELLRLLPGCTVIVRDAPIPFKSSAAETLSAGAAYARVLEDVGAKKPRRDSADAAIIDGVRNGTGRHRLTVAEDDWPVLRGGNSEPDGDGDGLPDAWERTHGLNAFDATDAARVAGDEGWTHLELWLNGR